MRDAFGMSGMLYMAIIILAMFVGLIAFSFAYTNAYKTKNKIIDILETYNSNGDTQTELGKFLKDNYYDTTKKCNGGNSFDNWVNDKITICPGKGVIITGTRTEDKSIGVYRITYKVQVPLYTNQPFLNQIFSKVNLYITGETKTIIRENK